jgi:hypothetical protein
MMKKRLFIFLILMLMSISLISCGSAPKGGGNGSTENPNAAAIDLTAEPATIKVGEFSIITAKIYNGDGELIEDNRTVSFRLDNNDLGSVTSYSSTKDGEAKVTFNSSGISGIVNVIASIDGISRSISIQINQEEKASVIELTTEPTTIKVGEFSIITAKIYNGFGDLIEDKRIVNFALDNNTLGSVASYAYTKNGEAKVTFNSSGISGIVNVIASIDGISKSIPIQINQEEKASVIELTTEPTTIVTGGFSIITAKVYKATGEVIEDGRIVYFSVDNTELGSVTNSSSTKDGEAKVTFNSIGGDGSVTVTAQIDGISKSITIYINKSGASSIEFDNATPQVIGLKGSGQTEVSEIKFLVKDYNGQPLANEVLVNLKLNGPNGGEYIGDVPGTKELNVYTINGYATVYLHSGNVPGTATVLATIDGTNLNTSSGVISIGGGFPSSKHFSISSDQLNLEGLAYDNIQTNVNVLLADRYGNYNVLEGTTVSFYSECGSIDRSVVLNDNGSGFVTFRTQQPQPYPVELCDNMSNSYCKREQDFIDAYWRTFGIDIKSTGHYPRMGLCTVVTVVDGEEEFTDANGNGLYDGGENFIDLTDIIIDKDDDKTLNPEYEHLIVDKNNNGLFDAGNGIWDNNTRISKEHRLLITGEPTLKVSKTNIILAYGMADNIHFNISDINFNRPSPTVINDVKPGFKVSTDCGGAQLFGTLESDFEDSSAIGSPIYNVMIINNNEDTNGESCSLKFEYRWHGKTYNYSIHVYLGPKPPDNGTSPNP